MTIYELQESKKKTPSMSIQWVMIQHVLLEKEIYIMKNVQWNDELQDTLVDEGMLIINLDHVSHNQDAVSGGGCTRLFSFLLNG